MDWRKDIVRQFTIVAIGQVVGVGILFGAFALLNKFDQTVLWGGIVGAVIALANFLAMALGAIRAAGKAEAQEVKAGQLLVQTSYLLRMVVLFLILFLLVKTGRFHVVALVVPLIFIRPALTVGEFIRKEGEKKA